MLSYKKTIFFITVFLAFLGISHQEIKAGSGLDDFASFFEELMSAEGNPFADLLSDDDASSKKTTSAGEKQIPTVAMPTKAQLTELATATSLLLSALNTLIKTTHPHHSSWSGAVYEKIKQHRHNFTNLESLILHIQAIVRYLTAKEIVPFLEAFKKYTKDILDLVTALQALPAAKQASIQDENAFLLGKTSVSPASQTPQEQKRRVNGITSLGKKTELLSTELQKLLAAPDLKKIFPEPAKAPTYKPSSSSKSYSPPPARSAKKSSSRSSWDSDYGSGRSYSSDYPYDDYYDYPDSSLADSSSDKTTENAGPDSAEEKQKPAYQAKEHEGTTQKTSEDFAELVKDFQENELVTTLLQCIEGGQMATNPEYFSTHARTFEKLFAETKDGGLKELGAQLKKLDKELASTESLLKTIKEEHKIEQPPLTSERTTAKEEQEAADKTKHDIAIATEAREDYLQTKQGITSAVLRLLYTPTQHRICEESAAGKTDEKNVRLVWLLPTHEKDSKPKKHLGMNISSNILDQEDVLCRHGREMFSKFLEILTKKHNLGQYIKIQEEQLQKEIDHFEDTRRNKVDMLVGTLTNTTLTNEHVKTLLDAVKDLAMLAQDLHHERPTLNTNDVHFYQQRKHAEHLKTKAILTEEQQNQMSSGLGTSRYMVNITLSSLEQALAKSTESIPLAEREKLSAAITAAKAGWKDSITEQKPSPVATKFAHQKLMQPHAAEDYPETEEGPALVPLQLPTSAGSKPVFQGISPEQLQKMLGSIAQPPQPKTPAKTSRL